MALLLREEWFFKTYLCLNRACLARKMELNNNKKHEYTLQKKIGRLDIIARFFQRFINPQKNGHVMRKAGKKRNEFSLWIGVLVSFGRCCCICAVPQCSQFSGTKKKSSHQIKSTSQTFPIKIINFAPIKSEIVLREKRMVTIEIFSLSFYDHKFQFDEMSLLPDIHLV